MPNFTKESKDAREPAKKKVRCDGDSESPAPTDLSPRPSFGTPVKVRQTPPVLSPRPSWTSPPPPKRYPTSPSFRLFDTTPPRSTSGGSDNGFLSPTLPPLTADQSPPHQEVQVFSPPLPVDSEEESEPTASSPSLSGSDNGNDNGSDNGSDDGSGTGSENETDGETEAEKRTKRNKRAKPETWKRNLAKTGRQSGGQYLNRTGVLRPSKIDKPFHPCGAIVCYNECRKVTEANREWVRHHYWSADKNVKREYIFCNVRPKPQKGKKVVNEYRLTLSDRRQFRVCRGFFANTLAESTRTVNHLLNPKEGPHKPTAAKSGRSSTIQVDATSFALTWLKRVSTVPSHYCRQIPQYQDMRFVEPGQTIAGLHRAYIADATDAGIRSVGITKYKQYFHQLKMSVFKPRKDQCNVCVGYKHGNVDRATYDLHVSRKNAARDEKIKDESKASEDDSIAVFTMDLQGILLSPKTSASTMYYKTKIVVHNYTYYNKKTKNGYCYFWDETQGDTQGKVFSSLHFDHVANYVRSNPQIKTVILWSDGCGYQSRNRHIANSFIYLVNTLKIKVYQKYFVPGHSQMECDSVHSVIERQLRHKDIYLPSDYAAIARVARQGGPPYKVQQLRYFHFTVPSHTFISSIRPGTKTGDSTVHDVCAYRYMRKKCEETRKKYVNVHYKLNFSDNWIEVPHKIKLTDDPVELVDLFDDPLPITSKKYNDLQDLKNVIPSEAHQFYDELDHL